MERVPLASGSGPSAIQAAEGDHVTSDKISPAMTSTTNEIAGYRVVRNLGVARGITVRTQNACVGCAGVLMILCGGRSPIFSNLCEKARAEAFQLLLVRAKEMGANAVLAARFDANALSEGVTEVLAYGTAVKLKPKP